MSRGLDLLVRLLTLPWPCQSCGALSIAMLNETVAYVITQLVVILIPHSAVDAVVNL